MDVLITRPQAGTPCRHTYMHMYCLYVCEELIFRFLLTLPRCVIQLPLYRYMHIYVCIIYKLLHSLDQNAHRWLKNKIPSGQVQSHCTFNQNVILLFS